MKKQLSGKIRFLVGLAILLVSIGGIDSFETYVLMTSLVGSLSGIGLMAWSIPSLTGDN